MAGSEFRLAQTLVITAEGSTMTPGQPPLTFEVKYEPIDLDVDVGSVSIGWNGRTHAHTASASLSGTGESATCDP